MNRQNPTTRSDGANVLPHKIEPVKSSQFIIEGINIAWTAKVFDEGSIFGINEGRISKLAARINDDWIFNYDRGWDIKPKDKIAKKAFKILVKKYK